MALSDILSVSRRISTVHDLPLAIWGASERKKVAQLGGNENGDTTFLALCPWWKEPTILELGYQKHYPQSSPKRENTHLLAQIWDIKP